MKTKILLLTLAAPVMFALGLGITLLTSSDPFKIFIAILFFLAVLASRLLSERGYIFNINVTSTTIEIQYYTPLLKLKSIKVAISDVTHIKFNRARWSPDYAATLQIKKGGESLIFLILGEEQFHLLEMQLSQLIQQAQSNSFQLPAKS